MSRWAVVGVPDALRHGGDLRASHLFRNLIDRTNALSFYRPDVHLASRAARHLPSLMPGVNVAAAELLPQASVPLARRLTRLRVLDLHDHPVLQAEAIGLPLDHMERARQQRLTHSNIRAFERVVVVSETFADLAEVPAIQRITIPNGTDTRVITPGPWPTRPRIGFVSGAAPGRGIEVLIEAARLVRQHLPDVELKLGLAATGKHSEAYLAAIKQAVAGDSWVHISAVPYPALSQYLADTTVLAIPHPAHPYIDSAVPVKLLDSMAAGRPLVVTPRLETSRIVSDAQAGIVTASDTPDDIASALTACLEDGLGQKAFGQNARIAAEQRYDWQILAKRLADVVL
jgi:glycosyltransferase involved in cell wall biosynthesis